MQDPRRHPRRSTRPRHGFAPADRPAIRGLLPLADWLEARVLLSLQSGDVVEATGADYTLHGVQLTPSSLVEIDGTTGDKNIGQVVATLPQPFGTATSYLGVAVDLRGRIVVYARDMNGGSTGSEGVYRLDPGAAAFTPLATVPGGNARYIAAEPNGDIVVATSSFYGGGVTSSGVGPSSLVVLDGTTGKPTPSQPPQPFGVDTEYDGLTVDPQGRIVVDARNFSVTGEGKPGVYRLGSGASAFSLLAADPGADQGGGVSSNGLAAEPNGDIVEATAALYDFANQELPSSLDRLDENSGLPVPSSGLPQPFVGNSVGYNSVTIDPQGRVVVYASDPFLAGATTGIYRLDPAGTAFTLLMQAAPNSFSLIATEPAPPPTDIVADSLDTAADESVNVTYDIVGGDLPEGANVDLYWSSSPTDLGQAKSAIHAGRYQTMTAVTAAGTPDVLNIPKSDLTPQPNTARYLVAVINADGKVAESDPNNDMVSTGVQTDLAITYLDWDRNQGGIDFTYAVLDANAPRATDISYFWASGPGLDSILQPAAIQQTLNPAMGTYPVPHPRTAASQFVPPPAAAKYLIVTLDYAGGKPGGNVPEEYKDNNTRALTIEDILAAPTLSIEQAPVAIGKLDPYAVYLGITNPMPINFSEQVTYSWTQLFPDTTLRNGKGGTKGSIRIGNDLNFTGVIASGKTQSVKLGDFANAWDWIDPPTKSPSQAILAALYSGNQAGDGAIRDKAISDDLKGLGFSAASNVLSALNFIKGQEDTYLAKLKPRLSTQIGYAASGTWKTTGALLSAGPYDFALVGVPKPLRDLYDQYVEETAKAKSFLGKAIASIEIPPEAAGWLAASIAAFDQADSVYRNAYDPPDPNYTALAAAVPIVVPGIEALPTGTAKSMAETALQLEAVIAAASASRDRADGAEVAGAWGWQAGQLQAAAGWMAQASSLETRLDSLQAELDAESPGSNETGTQIAATVQASGGLPASLATLAGQLGLSADQIASMDQTLMANPAANFDDANDGVGEGLGRLFVLSYSEIAADDLQSAVTVETTHLGQRPRAPTAAEQQKLTTLQATINSDLSGGSGPSTTLSALDAYRSVVQGLTIATASPSALSDAADFAESAGQQVDVMAVAAGTAAGTPPAMTPTPTPTPAPPVAPARGPVLATVSVPAVAPGSPVVFTEAATDPGYAVTYGLAPGYPIGALINPATGAFTWTPPALGAYAITILAIDDGPAAPASSVTFLVNVVSPALIEPLSLSPVELGRYEAVTTLYDQILGRAPDGQGLLAWMRQLDSDVSIAQVARDFAASPERAALVAARSTPGFSIAAASSDASIHGARAAELATIYDEVLERAADLPGYLYWTGRLGKGASLASVATAFGHSSERRLLARVPGTPKLNLATVETDALRNAAIVQSVPRGPA